MAEQKKIKSPFVFVEIHGKGQGGFDTEYKSIEIVDEVEAVGEPDKNGKQAYVIKKVVHETFRPIQEVIDADKESVGVYNIMKSMAFQDDHTIFADKGDGQLVDVTGAPESLMELKQMGVDAEKAFNKLPGELTQGMDMASFVNSLTQEQFDAFVNAMAERAKPAAKEKDGE